MIGYLKGRMIWQKENKVIVDVNGVGYLVEIADMNFVYRKNREVELFIHTYVREDTLSLYGFKTLEEKVLFITLLGISGIGPKAANNILSSIPYEKFINAILTENLSILKQVSGIGPKTAQRLVLELKTKVEDLALSYNMQFDDVDYDNELYDALTGLGYTNNEIDAALREMELINTLTIEEKIKKVLSYLGKES
ncbi:MAG: Holliday junction branch migration protein RuvA [Halanaerobiaceae bacterium]